MILLLKLTVGLLAFAASAYALAWAVTWPHEPIAHWRRWRWQNAQLRQWQPPEDRDGE